MKRPGIWIVVGLLLTAVGLAVLWYSLEASLTAPRWEPPHRTWQLAKGAGLVLSVAGPMLAIRAWLVHRRRSELREDIGILARWRVGLPDWAAFRRRDAARDDLFHSLRNRLRLPDELPPEGMDLRVGVDAMLIGDVCYGLGVGWQPAGSRLIEVGWVEGAPGMLEFVGYIYRRGGSKLTVARVPVPDHARAEAQRPLDHFEQMLDPRRRERIRESFEFHFQAAEGDAGDAEIARGGERSRSSLFTGASLFLTGALILGVALTRDAGPYTDATAVDIAVMAGGAAIVAGLVALAVSVLSRR